MTFGDGSRTFRDLRYVAIAVALVVVLAVVRGCEQGS